MTQRERTLMFVLLGLCGFVVVLGLAYFVVLRPLADIGQEETALDEAIAKKDAMVRALAHEFAMVKTARERSLPPNPHLAAIEYQRYLRGLMLDAGFKDKDVNVSGPSNLDAKAAAGAARPRARARASGVRSPRSTLPPGNA